MPRYMLDTDTCSYIMKRSHPAVLKRLQAIPVTDISMSVISLDETIHGRRRRGKGQAVGQPLRRRDGPFRGLLHTIEKEGQPRLPIARPPDLVEQVVVAGAVLLEVEAQV